MSAFPAGQQLQILQLLAGRLRYDIDAGLQYIIRLKQHQIGASAAEQLSEDDNEPLADLIEGRFEPLRHFVFHFADDLVQCRFRFDQIVFCSLKY